MLADPRFEDSTPPDKRDRDWLAQQFQELRPYLLALARRGMFGRVTADRSEDDLVQIAFVTVLEKLEQFRDEGPGQLKAWLKGILSLEIRRWLRTQAQASGARITESFSPAGAHPLDVVDPAAPFELQSENDEDLIRAHEFIDKMPELEQQIIAGRIERDESFPVLGARLGMPASTARMVFQRAMAQVSAHFDDATERHAKKSTKPGGGRGRVSDAFISVLKKQIAPLLAADFARIRLFALAEDPNSAAKSAAMTPVNPS